MPLQTLELVRKGAHLLSWYRLGYGDEWVIFLHGGCVDHAAFEEQLPAVDAAWNVLLPDLRAQGASRIDAGYSASFDDVIDDLITLCDQTGIRRAHLIGQSLGASVAQEFAWRYPERVETLVLIGCYDHLRRLTWLNWLRVKATVVALRVFSWEGYCAWCAKVSSRKSSVQQYIERCLRKAGRDAYLQLGVTAHNAMHPVKDDEAMHPTLLLRGDGDAPLILGAICKRMLARNSNAFEIVIPNAGHAANQDNPDATNEAIKKFFESYAMRKKIEAA